MSEINFKEALEKGLKVPFYSYEDGRTEFHELDKHSKLEIEYLDGSKKTMNALEYWDAQRPPSSKPNEIILRVKVLKN